MVLLVLESASNDRGKIAATGTKIRILHWHYWLFPSAPSDFTVDTQPAPFAVCPSAAAQSTGGTLVHSSMQYI